MNVQFLINYGQIDFFTFIVRYLAPMLSSCVTFGKGHYCLYSASFLLKLELILSYVHYVGWWLIECISMVALVVSRE